MRKAVSIAAFVVSLAVAAPASASVGPTGWWPFYEGSGTIAHDRSGNHNDGTINGAQWTTGYFGSGLAFAGHKQNVQIPDNPGFESQTLTVTAYVKAQGSPGNLRYIVSKGGFGCETGSYGLYTGTTGGLMFYVANSDAYHYTRSPDAGQGVWDGNWHFVVGTYDGTTVRLYVDGAEVGSGTADSSTIPYGGPTSNDLFIGHYEGCTRVDFDFTGSIDEPSVWDRALTANQVHFAYMALTTLHRFVSQLPAFPAISSN